MTPPDLRAALADLYNLVEEGYLVRSTTNDAHFPSFMAESLRLTTTLLAAQTALAASPLTPARQGIEPRGCPTPGACSCLPAPRGWAEEITNENENGGSETGVGGMPTSQRPGYRPAWGRLWDDDEY